MAHSVTRSIPIVVCGRQPQIMTAVVNNAKPELDVIHSIMSLEAGVGDLPILLKGEKLPEEVTKENLGSQNYTNRPEAVVFGGGYDEDAVATVREACKATKDVAWLRVDTSKTVSPPGPDYGKEIVKRLKEKVFALDAEGKLKTNEVYFF